MSAQGNNREGKEATNRILQVVERVFHKLMSEQQLEGAIEKWRWDEPVVTLSWFGLDSISRNIHTLAALDDAGKSEIRVDANAWIDIQLGGIRQRRWHNIEIGRLEITQNAEVVLDSDSISNLIFRGFRRIQAVKFDQLEKRTILP